ncbi:MAG: hypothetical protein KGQ51_10500 [Planctomycetes bacterium]|nr:hypothetical protein [Planctomycetota bacterium]
MKSSSDGSGKRGCMWIFWALVALLILPCAGVFSIWASRQSRDGKFLRKMINDLKERGAPIDNETLLAQYRSRTDPSDAPAWQQVFAELKSTEFKEWCKGIELFDPTVEGTAWTDSSWTGEAAERNLIAKTVDLRRRIHELTMKRSAVQFLQDFNGIQTQLNEIQSMRDVQRLLSTEFQVAFADRDSKACLASIEAQLDLALVCREDPFMVSQLVNLAIRGIAMHNIQRAIEYDVLTEEDLVSLLDRMSSEELPLSRLSKMIAGERVIALEAAKNPLESGVFEEANKPMGSLGSIVGIPTNRDIIHLLEVFESMEDLNVSDIDQLRTLAASNDANLQSQISRAGLAQMDWILTSLMMPAFSALAEALVRDVVRERFIRHGLAIRIYQKRHGRFPENLEQLLDVGLDSRVAKPWGGKPFGYLNRDGEVVLWATIPQDGPITSDEPPEIEEESEESLRKWFHLRFRAPKQ